MSASDDDAERHDAVLPLVYAELRRLAAGYLRRESSEHTLQPTALVNEAWMRLVERRDLASKDREHFLAVAAQTMRRVLVDHARRKQALKRDAGGGRLTLSTGIEAGRDEELDLVELNDLIDRLAAVDARAARVVEMRFFGGLTSVEIAGSLEISERTVDNAWYFARAWLTRALSESDER